MNPLPSRPASRNERIVRRGVVIVAVLLVVTLLSLAAYQYADMMTAEAQVAENTHRAAQVRGFAESGIWYAIAALVNNSNPANNGSVLNGGSIYNNPQLFQNIQIQGDNGLTGRFTIIGPFDPINGNMNTPTYGVSDETGKINLVSWMQIDPTGAQLMNVLGTLPNMTPQLAANIVAWMGGSAGIQAGGAQDDYYLGLNPPYRCKNNVPDSLDELLLVQGMTRDLLYGADTNRNGYQDGNEQPSTTSTTPPISGFDRGWSAYLTVYSREQNCDPLGNALIWINNPDLQQLYAAMVAQEIDQQLATFIILYQQYGAGNSSGGKQSTGSTLKALVNGASSSSNNSGMGSGGSGTGAGSNNSGSSNIVPGNLANVALNYQKQQASPNAITSFFQLVNATVNVTSTNQQTGQQITTQYTSPLANNTSYQRANLPLLFQYCTIYQSPEIPARINVNTAQQEILYGLENIGSSSSGSTNSSSSGSSGAGSGGVGATGLADTDVANIIQMRELATGQPDDIYYTPTWLLTEAGIQPTVLQRLEPYITTHTQVFRIQSVGYFDDGKGPSARIEAIVDLNASRPRILAWRNLSELGKGWVNPNPSNGNAAGAGGNP